MEELSHISQSVHKKLVEKKVEKWVGESRCWEGEKGRGVLALSFEPRRIKWKCVVKFIEFQLAYQEWLQFGAVCDAKSKIVFIQIGFPSNLPESIYLLTQEN